MTRTTQALAAAGAVALTLLLAACEPISTIVAGGVIGQGTSDVTRAVEADLQRAIDALGNNSSDWQRVLDELQTSVGRLEQKTADDVRNITSYAIGAAGAEVRCNADFLGARVKEDLEALLARLQGKPLPPRPASICTVTPPVVDMGSPARGTLYFTGYNFNRPDLEVVLVHAGGRLSLTPWTARNSPYQVAVNVSPTDGPPLCNLAQRRIQLQEGARVVSEVNVNATTCPGAPPPLAPHQATFIQKMDANFFGFKQSLEFGDGCEPGRHRVGQASVERLDGAGQAGCYFEQWVNTGDEHSCRAKVRFWGEGGVGNWIKCQVTIYQDGDPQPAPPCPCR